MRRFSSSPFLPGLLIVGIDHAILPFWLRTDREERQGWRSGKRSCIPRARPCKARVSECSGCTPCQSFNFTRRYVGEMARTMAEGMNGRIWHLGRSNRLAWHDDFFYKRSFRIARPHHRTLGEIAESLVLAISRSYGITGTSRRDLETGQRQHWQGCTTEMQTPTRQVITDVSENLADTCKC